MPSILGVEQEDRYVERIRAALTADGWKVRVVPAADQAIQAAASEAPDLVMVSAAVAAATTLAGAFSRSGGGPGVVGLLPEGAAFPPPGFAADDLLTKPFTDEALRAAAKRALESRRPAGAAEVATGAQKPPTSIRADHKLTSQDAPRPPRLRPARRRCSRRRPPPRRDRHHQERRHPTLRHRTTR